MKLKDLLLELDTREVRFPGIKDGETQKAYKARMKKEKEQKQHKSDTNKRYRLKQKALDRSTKHNQKEFELMSMALRNVNKGGHRNEYFLPDTIKPAKAPFAAEKDEMEVLPFTKAVAAKIKAITTNRGTVIDSERYWFLSSSEFSDVKEVLEDEMNAIIRKIPSAKLDAHFAESITIDELELLIVE